MLLLHGYPQHVYAWRCVMADLATDHRVYALDLRGADQTDAPRRGYDSRTLSTDVVAVLGALELPRAKPYGRRFSVGPVTRPRWKRRSPFPCSRSGGR